MTKSSFIILSLHLADYRSSAHFYPKDVLYSRLRPYLNKVVCLDFEGLASAEFIVFPDTPYLNSSFLKYRLNSFDFVNFTGHLNAGDRPRVDFEMIGAFELIIPPINEQKRIVAKIEELFSKLDAGIAALERVQANLIHYRAAVLKAAVEGNLTEDWRKQNSNTEPASKLLQRILKERRQKWESEQLEKYQKSGKTPPKDWQSKYKEPSAPDTANLPSLPDGWCWATLDQLIDTIEAGKSFKCQIRPANPEEWGIIKVSAMSWGEFKEEENKAVFPNSIINPNYEIKPYDLLLSRANTCELVGASVLVKNCRTKLLLSDIANPSLVRYSIKEKRESFSDINQHESIFNRLARKNNQAF